LPTRPPFHCVGELEAIHAITRRIEALAHIVDNASVDAVKLRCDAGRRFEEYIELLVAGCREAHSRTGIAIDRALGRSAAIVSNDRDEE